MKFLSSSVLVLLAALAFAVYQWVNSAIEIDHLQVAVKSLEKREVCLLRLSRPFVAAMKRDELKLWIKANMADLDLHDEETLILVNEVAFDLAQQPVLLE